MPTAVDVVFAASVAVDRPAPPSASTLYIIKLQLHCSPPQQSISSFSSSSLVKHYGRLKTPRNLIDWPTIESCQWLLLQ